MPLPITLRDNENKTDFYITHSDTEISNVNSQKPLFVIHYTHRT